MATWDDVRTIALSLPETMETVSRDHLFWRVAGTGFVWERPLRAPDLRALAAAAPEGPILGVRVQDLGVKDALIGDDPEVFFTIPHFDGYAAVLVRLERIGLEELREVIVEAWLCRAPRAVAKAYAAEHGLGGA